MRIVLDTNVVVSALLWRGTPHRLLAAASERARIELFTSAVLLEELTEVLLRPGPAGRFAIIGRTAMQVVADYLEVVEVVTPAAVASVIAVDPDDDHVIAAAVAAEVDLIVSGDRHLLAVGTYRTIRIVTPADAVMLVGS